MQPVKEQLAQSLFDHIPVGVGSKGIIPMNARQVNHMCIFDLSAYHIPFFLILLGFVLILSLALNALL